MNKITNKINDIKKNREKLQVLKEKIKGNKIMEYYQGTQSLANANIGLVVLITEDNVYIEYAGKDRTHQKVCEELLEQIEGVRSDFSKYDGDFGEAVAKEHNCIFIRGESIVIGPTIIYYPHVSNAYQIEKLSEYNEDVKSFNDLSLNYKVEFEYNGKTEGITYENLDELVNLLKFRLEREQNRDNEELLSGGNSFK